MNKVINYYSFSLPASSFGIENKLRHTVASMCDMGYKAELIFSEAGAFKKYISLLKLLFASKADVVIIRNLAGIIFCAPGLLYLRLRGVKVIVDVPTPIATVIQELKSESFFSRNSIYIFLFRFTFPFALWPASKILQYSMESDWYQFGLKRKTALISNGIDVDVIAIKNNKHLFESKSLTLIAVASLSDWHGFDRVIRGIAQYYNSVNSMVAVNLLIVGDGIIRPQLEELARKLNISNKIKFLGYQSGESLDRIFDSSHVAISSLGLYRIGIDLASVLKSREYTARGIPFISAGDDIDFRPLPGFVMRVSNDNSSIDIVEVIDWYKNVASKYMPEEIRGYAKNKLDYKMKIKELLS